MFIQSARPHIMTLSPLIRHQPSFASLRNYYSILKRISVVKNETARETTSLFTLMNIDPFAALCIFYLVCVRLCARAFVMLLMVLFIPRRMWLHRRRHAVASSILRSSLRYTPPLLRPPGGCPWLDPPPRAPDPQGIL